MSANLQHTHLDYFAALVGEDAHLPLFEAAAAIAHDRAPQLDLLSLQAEVDVLAATLRSRMPADISTVGRLRALTHYFFEVLEFKLDDEDYYDPANSFLDQVLARRRGIPITLALLLMEIGQQIHLDFKGVSFPGHFLLSLKASGLGTIVIDPVDGRSLTRETLEERLELAWEGNPAPMPPLAKVLRTATAREILVRMLRNLKQIYQTSKQWHLLLPVLERLLVLLPEDVLERRDRGLCYAHLECARPAIADLDAYLAVLPDAPDRGVVREKLALMHAISRRIS